MIFSFFLGGGCLILFVCIFVFLGVGFFGCLEVRFLRSWLFSDSMHSIPRLGRALRGLSV